jgi:hypothetical protein
MYLLLSWLLFKALLKLEPDHEKAAALLQSLEQG